MFMFLTILLTSFVVLAVSCVAFAAAAPAEEKKAEARKERRPADEAPRFFVRDVPLPSPRAEVPIEVLLSQLERHVRLEQAAAQGFLEVPTASSLHSRTESPLVVN